MSRAPLLLTALAALAAVTGCTTSDEMTGLEALQALQEVGSSDRGERAVAEPIEVSTDVTIGDAIESAAQTIADFWESQADCTTVTVEGNVATIDYGGLDDPCEFNGRTYAGVNTVAVESTAAGALEVAHTWSGFTDGEVTVDGGALVTWSGEDLTRTVATDHTWTDEASGEVVEVWGEHVQGKLDESQSVWDSGFTMDGAREWLSDSGQWLLDMSDLELRMVDPAPQAGSLTVTNPDGKDLSVTYERYDEDTIQATLSGLRGGDVVYHISLYGQYEEVEQ
jgi:hypothetical protein